ncbi:DSB repair complex subunit Ku70 [Microthyrium microscopicum]|uniref:ATP-dependent DNA helicase II subunit 1 n=1 Tax=Microthyrium microscopicum TaxID=703497 RepID=A0A6A6UUX2_9PEZI|nr:DSB repair complex subunit Ku70 [Microthyrium microscopicum]
MAGDEREERQGEEEEEEEIENAGYKSQKDAVLFAIDVSDSMLTPPKEESKKNKNQDSPTVAALKCAYQLMQQRIISNPNDMMGVLLFGTEESMIIEEGVSKVSAAYPHCYVVTDLDVPAASDVKRLRDVANDPEESEQILVPSTDDPAVSMSNVLFCANQIFTTKAPNFTSRRLFLVTDEDNPHKKDKILREAAAVRAKDLYDLGVTIELFPIARPGGDFDRTKFYDDIIYRGALDSDAPAPVTKAAKASSSGDGISLLQSLISSINSKAAPRRALFTLPMELGADFIIGVKGFITIKRQELAKSCYVWVGGEKPQIVTGVRTIAPKDEVDQVPQKLLTTETRKAYLFGGEQVHLSEEEKASLRNFGDPGIRVVGFKPLNMLPTWANTRPSVFVYPDETNYIGSTRVFSALQQNLLQSEKFALVWFIARKGAHPRMAAMIAGKEKIDENGEQRMPPGLWIITLPFADDIRAKPDIPLARASDSLVEKMKEIMGQLRLPKSEYDPQRYPNPSLQYFYRVLQSLALEEEIPEQDDDKTVPKYKQIYKRSGTLISDWAQELEEDYQKHEQSKPSTTLASRSIKRENDGDGPPSKRVKTETASMSDADLRQHYEKGTLAKLTVPVLSEWATKKQLHPASKKKADVVAAIESHFEK